MAKSTGKTKKNSPCKSPLCQVVGKDVYDIWLKMLKDLVPRGRTHRLSVVVASMLAYATDIAASEHQDLDENSPANTLLAASELYDDEAFDLLKPMLIRLFKDVKVKHQRVSSKGESYSIIEQATIEFSRWYNYPWE